VSPVIRSLNMQRGVSLIELMVALVIGLFLIFGAVTVYQKSRATLRTTEAVARLQEVARLAFDVLEADVRMASYWGLNNRAELIVNRAAPGQELPAPFSAGQGAIISQCSSNWGINLDEYIAGSNNGYTLGCAATGTASGASDTLVIRRAADAAPASLDLNRIYLQTSRIQGTLFVPGCTDPKSAACVPAAYLPPASQSRALVVHAYYVSTGSTVRADVPALRRKSLGTLGAGTADDEIVAGVEDVQVRFGIDTNGDANVDLYANPGAVPASAAVISATLWLRVRSEDREFGHVDGNSYQYADITTFTPADNYRRIVVSKTIQLRNTRI
jgi:type IV pilus assembly protein PilW